MTTSSARARLVPHLGDYDRLGATSAWRPYLMFLHHRNFTSPSVNTDRHGFRPTWDAQEQRVTLDDAGQDVAARAVLRHLPPLAPDVRP